MKFVKNGIAGVITTTLLGTSIAHGNENNPQNALQDPFEHIQIRGIRGSLLKAIDKKKKADQIIDAITAEDIGKFPDKNVAESLQRITGISLYRMMGEGERVGVRGTAPSQNLTLLNGQSVASSDWWISSQPSRGFNYTLLPSELVSSIEVQKSPVASMQEGSLGGAVIVHTHKPLDTEKNKLVARAQMQYTDLSGKWAPQFSAFYNWRDASDSFGLLTAVVKHKRHLRRDGLESWGWAERNFKQVDNTDSFIATDDLDSDHKNIWSPGGGGSAVFQQERDLSSLLTSFQWQLNKDSEFNLNLLYSNLAADNVNQNFLWLPSNSYSQGGLIQSPFFKGGTLVHAEYLPLDNQPYNTSMEAIWRDSSITQQSLQLEWINYSGYWRTQYQLGAATSSGDTDKDATSQWSANTRYRVDTSQQQNIQVSYDQLPTDAREWFLTDIRHDASFNDESDYYAQADFQYSLDHPIISDVSFGLKAQQKQRQLKRHRSYNGGLDGLSGQLNWSMADFNAPFPSGYLSGIGNSGTLKQYSFIDTNKLSGELTDQQFDIREEQASRFRITEDIFAGYVQLDIGGSAYHGNLGLRLVNTKQSSNGYLPTDNQPELNWQSLERSYTEVLPSINLAVDLTQELVVRTSAARVMARPDYEHIMPAANYNVTQAQGVAGNPNLDPVVASQFDVGLEWYWQEASLASVAVFYKNVRSFVDIFRNIEKHEGIDMAIDRPVNGPGGIIRGLEFGFQHEFFYGFGVVANYTLVDAERSAGRSDWRYSSVPGHSRHTYNFSAYYENDQLSGRLAYNYRTKYATGFGEQITDNTGQLDANITFHLSKSWDLLIEGMNLTDEVIYTYDRSELSPVGIYKNGRRWFIGTSYRF